MEPPLVLTLDINTKDWMFTNVPKDKVGPFMLTVCPADIHTVMASFSPSGLQIMSCRMK